MPKSVYILGTEPEVGKSAVALGVMDLLLRNVHNVAFFRPIIRTPDATGTGRPDALSSRDHDINLILQHFNLDIPYEDTWVYTLDEAWDLLNTGREAFLLEQILEKYKALEARYDFILCEGTDFRSTDPAAEFDLNTEIAANIASPVLLVSSARGKTTKEVVDSSHLTLDSMQEKGLELLAVIVTRTEGARQGAELVEALTGPPDDTAPCVYTIPEDSSLGNPSMREVVSCLDAKVLYGADRMDTLVEDYVIAAMRVSNFLYYIKKGSLVITPGDRADIILTSLLSRLSTGYEDISGILLTGGIEIPPSVHKLIDGWAKVPLPVLSTTGSTFETAQELHELYGRISPDDTRKITVALAVFESHVDADELQKRIVRRRSGRVTPAMFEYSLVEKASRDKQRIVLPEGNNERILRAAEILLRRHVAEIILLGNEDAIGMHIVELGLDLDDAYIIDPASARDLEDYAQLYYKAREHKGILLEQARDRMYDATYFGTMMVQAGHADGMVSGAENTTAHTVRPAFEFIKPRPGVSIVSSTFLMCLQGGVQAYADCAVITNPDAQQLAEIALSTAHTARAFGIEPRVAMLSYSTGSSGSGQDVDKVVEATALARERAAKQGLDYPIEGPLQFDAAVDPEVAATKMPNSAVAGQATVLIFPDLNTGNNTYKAVQRSGGAVAIGPILQGLNKPVNDLSRGCRVSDIVDTVAITAIQAQTAKTK